MNTINLILKTASLQLFPFLSAWLSSTIERIDKAGDAFVDWVTPAEPDWLWIGQGDVLFERTLSENGFVFVGRLKRDRETCARYFGEFGSDYKYGCLASGDGRFFYPAIPYEEHIRKLVTDEHLSLQSARIRAEILVRANLEMALRHENESPFYTLAVSVRSEKQAESEAPLAETSVSGLSAYFTPLKMDPGVEDLFQDLMVELVLDAIQTIRSICQGNRTYR
jgi:hypothetical protein